MVKYFHKTFDTKWKEKQLVFVAGPTADIWLTIPKEYLLMILTNLVSNATKYIPSGKKIFFEVSKPADNTQISIRDEGEGMDNEESMRIFDRFWRAKGGQKEGYGIGLSVVKQICDLYDITIKVFSEKGKGTKISLVLPIHT